MPINPAKPFKAGKKPSPFRNWARTPLAGDIAKNRRRAAEKSSRLDIYAGEVTQNLEEPNL